MSLTKPEPDPELKYEAKTRTCLKCGRSFESQWIGERVCRKCKDGTEWRDGRQWLPGYDTLGSRRAS